MKLLFLPPMALRAVHAIRAASSLYAFDGIIFLPKGALHWLIVILLGVSPIILYVVGIYTN